LEPIAGAQVGLKDTEFLSQTDASGGFALRYVPPGQYVLAAGGLGYEATARSVEVVAGEVVELRLSLRTLNLSKIVIHETTSRAGFLECAMGAVVFVAPCTYPYRAVHQTTASNGVNLSDYGAPPDLHDNRFWLNFTVRPEAAQIVAELRWEAGSAAANEMQLFVLCGDFDAILNECTEGIRYGSASGPSPVRVVVDEDDIREGCPDTKFCPDDGPVWFANDVAMPFNNPQFAFQQKFEVWDTIFYHGEGPEGFTALPDQ
jgi:hypothetical protein